MVKEDGWYLLVREGRWKYPMNQRSLSEIVAGECEEIKGYVLRILKEAVSFNEAFR